MFYLVVLDADELVDRHGDDFHCFLHHLLGHIRALPANIVVRNKQTAKMIHCAAAVVVIVSLAVSHRREQDRYQDEGG